MQSSALESVGLFVHLSQSAPRVPANYPQARHYHAKPSTNSAQTSPRCTFLKRTSEIIITPYHCQSALNNGTRLKKFLQLF